MVFRRSRLSELEPARRALARGEYDAAFSLLEDAARRPVGRAAQGAYLLHLAALYALYGDEGREHGEWVLREAAGVHPEIEAHPLYRALAWTFAAQRGERAPEARRTLATAAQRGDSVAAYHAADALLHFGEDDEARRVLEELEHADALPDYLAWRRASLLGQIHERAGRWDAAVDAFRTAVAICRGPEREAEKLGLAACQLEAGDPAGAAATLEEIGEGALSGFELADKRYLEGRTELDLGNPNRALERFRQSLELDRAAPPFDLLLATGQCLVELGRADEGARFLTEALADAPDDQRSSTEHERALALADADRLDEAETAFAAALDDPDYPYRAELLADLADLRLRRGEFDDAEGLARRALELGAAGPAGLTLGTIALEDFRFDDAAAHLEQAVAAAQTGDPVWLAAQQMLADAFAQRGAAFAERTAFHARAALAATDPGSDWHVILQRHLRAAEAALGDRDRVLN